MAEKIDFKKFFGGFSDWVGWFKALAIGLRIILLVMAVWGVIWGIVKIKTFFTPKKEVTTQTQNQAGVFTGAVGNVTYSQPVVIDYVKIADIVASKQKKYFIGGTVVRDGADNDYGIVAGLNF